MHQTSRHGFWNRVGLGSLVTDETFGVAITPYLKGEAINDRWMHGLNITAYLFWAISCVAGALFWQFSNPQTLRVRFCYHGYVYLFGHCAI
ncbi:AzlC family ABC transporter permease [Staphylococcus aureus]